MRKCIDVIILMLFVGKQTSYHTNTLVICCISLPTSPLLNSDVEEDPLPKGPRVEVRRSVNADTNEVVSVVCRFCLAFGREEKNGGKRARLLQ